HDPYKPMFIRPIQAQYPPGSVFKVVSALTAQQAGMIEVNTVFNCPGGYRYGGGRAIMRCTHVDGSIPLITAIQRSCNTYFGYTYARMIDHRTFPTPEAYTLWRAATMKFGIRHPLRIDLHGEKSDWLPTA